MLRPVVLLALLVLALPLAAAPPCKVTSARIHEEGPGWSIDLRYPQLWCPGRVAAGQAFNKTVGEWARRQASNFKQQFRETRDPNPAGTSWTLACNYEVVGQTSDVVSILISGSDFTGGAHPNPFYETFTFHIPTGRRLGLADLFVKGSDYLSLLSSYCTSALLKRNLGDEKWVRDGAAPRAENYQFFYLTRKGLVVLFPPYQVAPYAAGPQKVLIPYKTLQPAWDPRGPAASMAL
ncbi:MAG TPA: DUF3298 domain-containing protein [Candidatus Nitrosotenuis sp.]|jgi:hypothetical protein|nr:DUF3298 domain-containing protein [Candidatus Nitrosotenuis sp.]